MTMDIAIRGGRVIDPANGIDAVQDIFIRGRHIAQADPSADVKLEVDAAGCIVTPGLIDMHVHMYNGGTGDGFPPDLLLPFGVTAVVDGGSAGADTFPAFARSVLASGTPSCFALINVSPVGIPTAAWPELIDPRYFSAQSIRDVIEAFPGLIKGLKIRMSRNIARELELKPMESALAMAEELGLPLIVHTNDPPRSAEELVSLLRKGDVYAHCFNPYGSTILDSAGKVKKAFHEARERGVIFDTSSARIHSSFPMVKSVLEQGFYPDVLSTDLINHTINHPFVHSLTYIMTYYMSMGMDLVTAVRCATQAPAAAMGLDGLGTLSAGSLADVAIFRMEEQVMRVKDFHGNYTTITQWLVPQMTIAKGLPAFRQMLFRTE